MGAGGSRLWSGVFGVGEPGEGVEEEGEGEEGEGEEGEGEGEEEEEDTLPVEFAHQGGPPPPPPPLSPVGGLGGGPLKDTLADLPFTGGGGACAAFALSIKIDFN